MRSCRLPPVLGRDLGDWLRRDFFKRHAQQFKNRPIAWHLRSPEGAFEAFVLYHRLSRETLAQAPRHVRRRPDRPAARRAGAGEGARRRRAPSPTSRSQIEDVEAFRDQLEAIERGDDLQHRIRCRWKDETDDRPARALRPRHRRRRQGQHPSLPGAGLLPAKVIASGERRGTTELCLSGSPQSSRGALRPFRAPQTPCLVRPRRRVRAAHRSAVRELSRSSVEIKVHREGESQLDVKLWLLDSPPSRFQAGPLHGRAKT